MRTLRKGRETIDVEPFSGVADDGSLSYGSSTQIDAVVVKGNERSISDDGSDIRVDLSVWVDAGESTLPDVDDRLTVGGTTYIVETRNDVEELDGTLDHVRLGAVEE